MTLKTESILQSLSEELPQFGLAKEEWSIHLCSKDLVELKSRYFSDIVFRGSIQMKKANGKPAATFKHLRVAENFF